MTARNVQSTYFTTDLLCFPHDIITGNDISSHDVQNVYVSLVAKDGYSSKLIWLTDYKENSKISADILRVVKISDAKFALIYLIINVAYMIETRLKKSSCSLLDYVEYLCSSVGDVSIKDNALAKQTTYVGSPFSGNSFQHRCSFFYAVA